MQAFHTARDTGSTEVSDSEARTAPGTDIDPKEVDFDSDTAMPAEAAKDAGIVVAEDTPVEVV
jgi:hypothetical protein